MQLFDFFSKKSAKQQPTIHFPAYGSTQIAYSVARIVKADGGWKPLGFDRNQNYVVQSFKTGQLVTLNPSDLTPKTLRAVVGAKHCEKFYRVIDPQTGSVKVDYNALIEDIVTSCDKAGLLSPDSVRSTGLCLEGDRLQVHYGNEVRMSDGTPVDITPSPSRVYVAGPSLDFTHDTPCATAEDVQNYLRAVESFSVDTPGGHKLLAGSFVVSNMGAALECRPIFVVDADRASGKTTVVELHTGLSGVQALRREGMPTVAQVLYELEHQQRAVYCDEVEARGSNRQRFEALAELARAGFTQASQPTVGRVIGGKIRYFKTPSCVLFFGISVPGLNPATESRTIRIRLSALSKDAIANPHPLLNFANRQEVGELGKRLRRLLIARYGVLRDSYAVLHERLVAIGHEVRVAMKYAVVLAGWFALTRDAVPASEDVESVICEVGLNTVERSDVTTDSELCLDTLLASRIAVYRDSCGQQLKVLSTIGNVVNSIIAGPAEERSSLCKQLEDFGIRVEQKHDKWKLVVSTFTNHLRLKLLFRGTDWALGGWRAPLLRLPTAAETVQRIGTDSRPQRAVMLDVPNFLMSPAA